MQWIDYSTGQAHLHTIRVRISESCHHFRRLGSHESARVLEPHKDKWASGVLSWHTGHMVSSSSPPCVKSSSSARARASALSSACKREYGGLTAIAPGQICPTSFSS